MNGFKYTLKLEEPILANQLAGDENSARSLPYIPGGLVRGILIDAYLREKELKIGDADNEEFRRLFLDGQTRYLNAYPLEDNRTLPFPLSWKVRKKDKDDAKERLVDLFDMARESNFDDELKSVGEDHWWPRGHTVQSREVQYQVNVHTQRDAVLGRAKGEGQGTVFRYEALPVGLRVQGVVLFTNQDDIKELKKWLTQKNLLIGKARTAGYGKVVVESVEDLEDSWREGWKWEEESDFPDYEDEFSPDELELSDTPTEKISRFTLTFLSAGLVRNKNGQFTLDPLPALKSRLGVLLKPIQGEFGSPKIFRMDVTAGGFNRKWGLPLYQANAIAPGSVFVLEADPLVTREELLDLEASGIGERRAEGFGRVMVEIDHSSTYDLMALKWRKLGREREAFEETEIQLDDSAVKMAEMMLQRLLRQELDEKLLNAVHECEIHGLIPNSQLSRWRVLLRSVLGDKQLERITKFHAEERKRHSPAWRKMYRARVNVNNEKSHLPDWIFNVLTGEESPWIYMGYGKQRPEKSFSGSASFVPDETMTLEYKIRLIEGVLEARIKKNNNEGIGDSDE